MGYGTSRNHALREGRHSLVCPALSTEHMSHQKKEKKAEVHEGVLPLHSARDAWKNKTKKQGMPQQKMGRQEFNIVKRACDPLTILPRNLIRLLQQPAGLQQQFQRCAKKQCPPHCGAPSFHTSCQAILGCGLILMKTLSFKEFLVTSPDGLTI